MRNTAEAHARALEIQIGGLAVWGDFSRPEPIRGLVIFAHGSGSSRRSPRNKYVAQALNQHALGTLLADLLTPEEEREDEMTGRLRFDIGLLTERLTGILDWAAQHDLGESRRMGFFGASTGAAAALAAAAARPEMVNAVVSRGGRPDLAEKALEQVTAPTLMIVGGNDSPVLHLNRTAMGRMRCPVELQVVPGATHLFEEPGALEQVARLASGWFTRYLDSPR